MSEQAGEPRRDPTPPRPDGDLAWITLLVGFLALAVIIGCLVVAVVKHA